MTFRRLLTVVPLLLIACESDPPDTDKPVDTGSPPTPGCITVDGEGTYTSLNDAMAHAADGATIRICAGIFEETVFIDQPVTILGAGAGQTFWWGTMDGPAFWIVGTSVITLGEMTISSPANAISAMGTGTLTLHDLEFVDVGLIAITLSGSQDAVVAECRFADVPDGAIRVVEGMVLVSGSVFESIGGNAISARDSVVSIIGSEFTRTRYIDNRTSDDGFAISATYSSQLDMENNTFTDNEMGAVWADDASRVFMRGDLVVGGKIGVEVLEGWLDLRDMSIIDPSGYGVFFQGREELFEADGLDIWCDRFLIGNYFPVGVRAENSELVIRNAMINGCYRGGIVATSSNVFVNATLTLENVTVEDIGNYGVYANGLEVNADNLGIEAARSGSDAFMIWNGTLDWNGGSLTHSSDGGLKVEYSEGYSSIENVSFLGNSGSAIAIEGSNTVSILYSTFDGNLWGDIYLRSSSASIVGNTFMNGDSGITIWSSSSAATVEGNTWSAYQGTILTIEGQDNDVSLSAIDNEVDGWGGNLLKCMGSDNKDFLAPEVTISGFVGTNGGNSRAFDVLGCDLHVDDLSLDHLEGLAGTMDASWVDMENVRFSDVGTGVSGDALTVTGWEFTADGLIIEDVASGSGLRIGGPYLPPMVNDFTITNAANHGLVLETGVFGVFTNGSITGSGGNGIDSSDANFDLDNVDVSSNGGDGARFSGGAIHVVGGTYNDNGGDGIRIQAASTWLDDATISGNLGTGIDASGAPMSFVGNTIENNGGWGMCCSKVAIEDCANTVSGNLAGENSGCPEECVVPP